MPSRGRAPRHRGPPDTSLLDRTAASPATCASRSPRSARCAAPTACRPRDCRPSRARPADPGRDRAAGRDRGAGPRGARHPVHRRRAAHAGGPRGDHRAALARSRAGAGLALAHHQRHRPRQAHRRTGRLPGSPASTSPSTPSTATTSPGSPAATACRRCSPASRPPERAGMAPVKINAVLMRRHARRRSGAHRLVADERRAAALHRADAAGCGRDLGPRHPWSTAAELVELMDGRLTDPHREDPSAPAEDWLVGRRRRPRSASSPRSPARSARRATAPGSPRRAPCARACSATRRPTCAGCCAAARTTRPSPTGGAPRCGTSRPATAWTATTSSGPMRSMGAIGG